ncbi:uncharacterized protein [Aegilops tauschii subsp. strangulata]|uniref:uncharacterized protein n=1 Tax=Aegilops tauschii subsp. strangulata TaxID=200361 RepID=UPI003CC880FC
MPMADTGVQPNQVAAAPRNGGGGGSRSRTPPRERSRGRSRVRRERQVVIHLAAATERAPLVPSAGTTFPMLKSTNYIEWSLVMKVHLESWGLWDAIEGNPLHVRDDKTALGVLFRAIPPEMLGVLVVKATEKEAWDTIKVMCMGVHRVREATVQRLRTEFEQIAFRDGETLDAFGMRITSLVNQLRTLGDNVEEIAVAIKTMLDLRTISVEELIGRLRTAEERCGAAAPSQAGGELLLTEQQCEAHHQGRETGQGSGGGNGNGGQNNHRGKNQKKRNGSRPLQDGGNNVGGSGGRRSGGGRDMSKVKCYNCNKTGTSLATALSHGANARSSNIVSIGQLDEIAYETTIHHGVLQLHEPGGRLLARVQRNAGRLYILQLTPARLVCLAVHGGEDSWRWHARYGHVNFRALRQLARDGMVHGLPLIDEADRVCEACLAGKHRRAPFPDRALNRATTPLELVHADLCGPISPPTPGGKRYFLLLVDDHSRHMWLVLLPPSLSPLQSPCTRGRRRLEDEEGHKTQEIPGRRTNAAVGARTP